MTGWISYDSSGRRREWQPPTEDTIATQLAEAEAGRLRYCHDARAWFVFDGALWRRDRTGEVMRRLRALARRLAVEPGGKVVATSGRPGFVVGAERFLRDEPGLAVTAADWDASPQLIGTPDGPVDLASGSAVAPAPEQGLSKATAAAPAPPGTEAPAWTGFLAEAIGDPEAIGFLQRYLGAALAGERDEPCVLYLRGAPGSGKTLLLSTLLHVLGDYAQVAELATLGDPRSGGTLAALAGVRLVTVADGDQAWAGRRLRPMVGGDPIPLGAGRAMAPSFRLLVAGTRAPRLADADTATRRRLRVLPLHVLPAGTQRGRAEALRGEAPAILRFMIDGAIAFRDHGLGAPRTVSEATAASLGERDIVDSFLAARCELGDGSTVPAAALWQAWCGFAAAKGEPPGTTRQLAEALAPRGIRRDRTNSARFYRGLGLRAEVTGDGGDS